MKSYHYSKKLTATTNQQVLVLPQLRNVSIINTGDNDIQIEFENDINDDSIIIPSGSAYDVPTSFIDLRYKSVEGESVFYVAGLKHQKS